MDMRILIVEDNADLCDNMSFFLEKEGHSCQTAGSFKEAMSQIERGPFDIILLDIMLPDGNGMDLLYRVYGRSDIKPGVIIISAKNALDDRVRGLDLGADDYLTKPFHLSELNARINAISRRRENGKNSIITFNEIRINMATFEAWVHDATVVLTPKEMELLIYFVQNKNRVLSKHSIAEHLWGDQVDFLESFDFVYQHIKNLRRKLIDAGARDYISNVYGIGYKMKSN